MANIKSFRVYFGGRSYDRIMELSDQYKIPPLDVVNILVSIGDYYISHTSEDIIKKFLNDL